MLTRILVTKIYIAICNVAISIIANSANICCLQETLQAVVLALKPSPKGYKNGRLNIMLLKNIEIHRTITMVL